jgi:hypothetical protein
MKLISCRAAPAMEQVAFYRKKYQFIYKRPSLGKCEGCKGAFGNECETCTKTSCTACVAGNYLHDANGDGIFEICTDCSGENRALKDGNSTPSGEGKNAYLNLEYSQEKSLI